VLEPVKPVPVFIYRCDSHFHTEVLKEMLDNRTEKTGFIVVDGSGALMATVQGNSQTVLTKYCVTLPKKHNKGGQSSVRFARLREIARHNYLTKVKELAVKCFIDEQTNQLNVNGIILAGSADFKDQLQKVLEPRLQEKVLATVDVAYGFNQGLNQAVELASDVLKDVALVRQKKVISQFFGEIAVDSGKICFGAKETVEALESGIVQTLVVDEKLDLTRSTVINTATGEREIVYAKKAESPLDLVEKLHKKKADSKSEEIEKKYEIIESVTMLDWLVENYSRFGAEMEIVQDCTGEGSQFCRGFGGLGGLLRYKMDFNLAPEGESDETNNNNLDEDEDDLAAYFD